MDMTSSYMLGFTNNEKGEEHEENHFTNCRGNMHGIGSTGYGGLYIWR